jgi:hypothetical protein
VSCCVTYNKPNLYNKTKNYINIYNKILNYTAPPPYISVGLLCSTSSALSYIPFQLSRPVVFNLGNAYHGGVHKNILWGMQNWNVYNIYNFVINAEYSGPDLGLATEDLDVRIFNLVELPLSLSLS